MTVIKYNVESSSSKALAQKPLSKKWLYASLTAAALMLGACSDKSAATTEDDPSYDAQTSVEQAATGVASTDNEVAIARADDGMANDDMMTDDVAVATADESEVLDGSESEEHVSTY